MSSAKKANELNPCRKCGGACSIEKRKTCSSMSYREKMRWVVTCLSCKHVSAKKERKGDAILEHNQEARP